MQKRNYGQVKRQKEATRKARQQEKQERRREKPADQPAENAEPTVPAAQDAPATGGNS